MSEPASETRLADTAPALRAGGGLWSDALPAVFVVLWATGFIGSKLGAPYSEPFTFLAIRFAGAALLMIGIAIVMRVSWPRSRTAFVHAVVIGLLVHGAYLGGVFWAIDRGGVSPGIAALIVGMQPLLTSLGAGLVLGEAVTRRHWLGLIIGFAGLSLVVSGNIGSGGDALGIAACFISMAGISPGSLYQKSVGANTDLRSQQAVGLSAAAILLGALSLGFEEQAIEWSAEFVIALAWLTLVMSLGTFTLLYVLIRRGAASKVSSLFYLVPPVAALMAWGLFGETLTPMVVVGMGIAVAGVALASRG